MNIFYTMEVGISGNDVNKHYITNLSMVKIYENDGLQVDFSKQLVINFKPYGEEDKSVSNLNWFTRNNNKQFGDTEMEAIFKINTYFPDEPVNLIQMKNETPIEYGYLSSINIIIFIIMNLILLPGHMMLRNYL